MDFKGKTVVVTGAAQGLGRKIAEMAAGEGANLALVDLDEKKLKEAKKLCADGGCEARDYAADVTDESGVEKLFKSVREDFGRVDALINNAGTNKDGLLVKVKDGKIVKKMSAADFRTVIDVDLVGVFLCAREAAIHMIEGGEGGVIVNISSISRAGNVGQTNYSAAKAGVAAMTVTWAKELARHKIRVAAIAPGFSDTRMVSNIPQPIRDKIVSGVPLQRLGTPEEIGDATLFILRNEFYDGRILEIDGGLRL